MQKDQNSLPTLTQICISGYLLLAENYINNHQFKKDINKN